MIIQQTATFITEKLAGEPEKKDPFLALRSLEIDAELVKTFTPLFEQAGFRIVLDAVRDPTGMSRKLTLAKNGGSSLYVIAVDKCVLGEFTDVTFSAFNTLLYLFGASSKVRIISRDLDVPDLGFDSIIEQWEQFKKIRAVVIPWKHIAALLRENDSETRFQKFQLIFKLEPCDKPVSQAAGPITDAERDDILRIMSAYASGAFNLTPQAAMQNLVLAADFPDAGNFSGSWSGDPNSNSLRLLKWAKDDHLAYPQNHPRKGQSMLGWLLKALHDQTISSEDKVILARIVVDHALIEDAAIVSNLRTEASDPDVPRHQP